MSHSFSSICLHRLGAGSHLFGTRGWRRVSTLRGGATGTGGWWRQHVTRLTCKRGITVQTFNRHSHWNTQWHTTWPNTMSGLRICLSNNHVRSLTGQRCFFSICFCNISVVTHIPTQPYIIQPSKHIAIKHPLSFIVATLYLMPSSLQR